MVNIAILSTAHIHSRSFLKNLEKGKDGRRTAVIWDDVQDRGQRYAKEFHTRFEPSLEKALRDPSIDGFIICAENTRHLPLLKKALPVGKPVFCEKPLVTTAKDLQEVKALLKKYPTTLMSGYFYPFGGDMQAVSKLKGQKAFGKITRVKFRNAHHAAYGHWFDNPDLRWFFNPQLSGGGAFMDMGTHAIHLLRSLFGPVKEGWAAIANHAGIYPQVDDFGVAHLKFASGVLGTVEAAWTQTGGIGGLEIVGSEKTLWNNGKGYVIGQPDKDPVPVKPTAAKPTGVDRLVAIIQRKLTKAELKADLEAVQDAVAIMDALYASSRSGKWVKVPKA